MITTTSSSNGMMSKNLNKNLSDFKKSQFRFLYGFALKKCVGWIGIYSILLTLCYPLITWKENYEMAILYPNNYATRLNYALSYHAISVFLVSALMCGMVLVFSAVLYSYMHSKRAADFFHSMPVDRSIMLSANFAAGLTGLTVPILISSLLSMVSYPIFLPDARWTVLWKLMGLEMLAWTMGALILFAISTLVAVCVSTAVENVGYTVAVLLEGSIMILIWDLACGMVFDTYVSIFSGRDIASIFENLLYYFSPVFALGRVIVFMQDQLSLTDDVRLLEIMNAWLPLLVWLLLGVGAFVLALKLYNKRQSERAEQWGRQSWLGFSVKLMSAIVGGFLFAVTFGEILSLDRRVIFTFGAIVGSPLVYLIIEAITNRGFHSMKKCLPYLALSTGLIVAASLYFAFDGFGFDKKIPNPERVQTVELELNNLLVNRVYTDEYAMKYEVLPNGDDTYEQILGDRYISIYELEDLETIELITEIHQAATQQDGDYLGAMLVSYQDGFYRLNRDLSIRTASTESMLQLIYSDEMLEKYNPFFELEADYLEFVQVTDRMGNLVGAGEIPKEHWDELLNAIRSDLKNAEEAQLLDSETNREIAQLTFVTKYPKVIFQNYGALYHHDTSETYVVRAEDEATLQVLKELGLEFTLQDDFYGRLISATVHEAYSKGMPGIAREYDPAVFDKYDYYVEDRELTDMETLRVLAEHATSVDSGRGNQYVVDLFVDNGDGLHISNTQYFVDRTVVAEQMVKNNNFIVPYILTHEEKAWLNDTSEVMIAENPEYQKGYAYKITKAVPMTEEYWYWNDIKELENTVSMKAYCEQYCPRILEGKTSAELKCMEMTPFLTEYGSRLTIGF